MFEAVIAWVNHDKDVRQEHLAHLMEHVRLPLLSREYLVQVCLPASASPALKQNAHRHPHPQHHELSFKAKNTKGHMLSVTLCVPAYF